MDYNELRGRYPAFYYHEFSVIETEDELQILFDFEIEGLSHFNPDFIIPKPASAENIGDLRSVRECAFSLGMMELISYWKITCAPEVYIECGCLDDSQVRWWKKLYFNGLEDFFRLNMINADPDEFMQIRSVGNEIDGLKDTRTYHGNLIPVAGGKDSFVTLDILKDMKDDSTAFVINHVRSAVRSAEAAGYRGKDLIIAERSLDSRMLEFNKQGYLNGHTPYSALTAFAAALAGMVYARKYICLSNEASETDSEVRGSSVAQQYSRTFTFEQDFNYYMEHYVSSKVHYFSLLRPLSELQITGIFSKLKPYHSVFCSCNAGQKMEKWCGHCARCLFVCCMLSAYLTDDELTAIFGTDILNDTSMTGLFDRLAGLNDRKTSENSGLSDEVNTAAAMSVENHLKAGRELPKLYQHFVQSPLYPLYRGRSVNWDRWNNENIVPEEYQKLIRARLEEMK